MELGGQAAQCMTPSPIAELLGGLALGVVLTLTLVAVAVGLREPWRPREPEPDEE